MSISLQRCGNPSWCLVRGFVGGIVASYLMRISVQMLDRWHGHCSRYGTFGLDREADVRSLQLLARTILRRSISEKDAERLAALFHYSYGAFGGLAYPVLSAWFPLLGSGRGVGFGAAIWLLGDELPISALGISDPFRKHAASHLYALLVHLMYGLVVDTFVVGTFDSERTASFLPGRSTVAA